MPATGSWNLRRAGWYAVTAEEYLAAILDVAYLAACAVEETVPDPSRVERMDPEKLYEAADRHLLTGITAMALESAGVKNEAFTQAKGKAIRKAAAFDLERAAILDRLEEAGIWHLPLKGCVLQALYPKLGMRQMSDNDILYDASRTSEVRQIMESLGFSSDRDFGKGVHDHYYKPPVCNFEMHRALFGAGHEKRFVRYYRDVKSRLILDEGKKYGCHFSDEDFYIFLLAHEYKHYSGRGTGLRSVLDTYVYLKKKGEALDWTYIAGELDKLGIGEFEAQNRSLALHLFGGEDLTERDLEMLDYILSSGTYGTLRNRVKNDIGKYGTGPLGKLRYLLRRIFLPMALVREAFPLFVKCPILLPFLPLYRVVRGLTINRTRMKAELKALVMDKHKQD